MLIITWMHLRETWKLLIMNLFSKVQNWKPPIEIWNLHNIFVMHFRFHCNTFHRAEQNTMKSFAIVVTVWVIDHDQIMQRSFLDAYCINSNWLFLSMLFLSRRENIQFLRSSGIKYVQPGWLASSRLEQRDTCTTWVVHEWRIMLGTQNDNLNTLYTVTIDICSRRWTRSI